MFLLIGKIFALDFRRSVGDCTHTNTHTHWHVHVVNFGCDFGLRAEQRLTKSLPWALLASSLAKLHKLLDGFSMRKFCLHKPTVCLHVCACVCMFVRVLVVRLVVLIAVVVAVVGGAFVCGSLNPFIFITRHRM